MRSLAGKKVSTGKAPSFSKGGRLSLQDQLGQFQILALAPGDFKNIGKQNMFARTHRIDILISHQPQQGRDRAGNLFAQDFAVLLPLQFRRGQGGQHTDGNARIRTGCIDCKLRRIFERQDSLLRDAPLLQTLTPGGGRIRRRSVPGSCRRGARYPDRSTAENPGEPGRGNAATDLSDRL